MQPPKIGVTVPRCDSRVYAPYLERVREAGGEPIEIAPGEGDPMDMLDGLLLPGGGDVEPALYGELPHAETDGVRPELDALEIRLVGMAREQRLPILAICRGHQLLNVALGGKLHQHIEGDAHRAMQAEGHPSRWHFVRVDTCSRLGRLLRTDQLLVNSRHHQAVRPESVARDLAPVALSADGYVEAMESRDSSWVTSVQWHPERDEIIDCSRPLFQDFVQFALKR